MTPPEDWGHITDTVDILLIEPDSDDEEGRRSRLEHLRRALTEFDAMTVSTIHGFCHRLLTSVGVATAEISSDSEDISEVVHDVILAGQHTVTNPSRVIDAVKTRLALPDARMATFPDAPDEVQAEINDLIEIIEASVDEVVRRRRCWRRGTFDSMLVDTRDLLCDEVRGPSIIAELRSRFRLVLVDEFQDTDTVQWKIFRTAFIEQHTGIPAVPLVVVGDPKQSIYRFRGAELSAYLEAVEYADQNGGRRFHLDTNYRSDADMLIALEHVLGQATFGDDRVGFEPVLAGREMSSYGLSGEQPPTQIRSIEPPLDSNGSVDAGTARNWVLADVVAEVVRLLGESRITRKHDASAEALRPSDIGIVVKSNSDAELYASALRAAGIPAVTAVPTLCSSLRLLFNGDFFCKVCCVRQTFVRRRTVAIGVFGDVDVSQVDDLESEDEAELLSQQHQRVRALASEELRTCLQRCAKTDTNNGPSLESVASDCSPTLSTLVNFYIRAPEVVHAVLLRLRQHSKNCDRVPLIAQQVRR